VELAEINQVKAIQEGNESTFEMIFRMHYQPLCRYAYTLVHDRDDAEEIVQATFLNIWEKKGSLQIESSLKSYLYRAVRNACLNAIKHVKIKQRHAEESLAVSEKAYESVTQTVISEELDQKIGEAMMALPQQCRLIFQLSRFEELKYAEIAAQLNISIKTVENQMGKALKIMREQLKEYLPILLILMNGFIN